MRAAGRAVFRRSGRSEGLQIQSFLYLSSDIPSFGLGAGGAPKIGRRDYYLMDGRATNPAGRPMRGAEKSALLYYFWLNPPPTNCAGLPQARPRLRLRPPLRPYIPPRVRTWIAWPLRLRARLCPIGRPYAGPLRPFGFVLARLARLRPDRAGLRII